MKSLLACVLILCSMLEAARAQCDPGFRLARYYGSNMVLQRAPARPRIWGYHSTAGVDIIVNLDSGSQTLIVTTAVGPEGLVIWDAVLQPITTEGPHSISVQISGTSCVTTLTNILMGDVYICSGQSNMEHRLDNIDNPQPDVDDVVNYPKVRSFFGNHQTSNKVEYDLLGFSRNWAEPTTANMAAFSAVCWLFGKNLFQRFNRPIGLIETNWGGTRIEAWSSPAALANCYTTVPPGDGGNAASVLYNAMIHPYHAIPIFGAIWYQGESNANAGSMPVYNCLVKSMVDDWRQNWHARNPEMDATFSFGQVQLAPNTANINAVGYFPDIRWHQSNLRGYAPNEGFEKIYFAVAIDLPDFNSPYGSIHPRYKRQIADRLALAASNVAYGSTAGGLFQGPLPQTIGLDGGNVRINYGLPLQYGDTSHVFEVCCSAVNTATCSAGGGTWTVAPISEQNSDNIALTNPCAGGQFVTGFRYLWRESPCPNLEACPIYSVENNLPAPPYIYEGLISRARITLLDLTGGPRK